MCGRFEQSESRRYYASALGVDTSGVEWLGGDPIPQYNVSPGRFPLMLHMLKGKIESDHKTWGYRTPEEAAAKKRPWINARVEKGLDRALFPAHVP